MFMPKVPTDGHMRSRQTLQQKLSFSKGNVFLLHLANMSKKDGWAGSLQVGRREVVKLIGRDSPQQNVNN